MQDHLTSFPGDEFSDSSLPPEWEDLVTEDLLRFERAVHEGTLESEPLLQSSVNCPESVARLISGMQRCLLQIEEIRQLLERSSTLQPESLLLQPGDQVNAAAATVFDPSFGMIRSDPPGLEDPAENSGIRLGKFRIISKLGEGTYGIVYQAFDPQLQRIVAVKVPSLNTIGRLDLRTRFLREGESAARLKHPNIVTVFEAVSEGPVSLIVSEYIAGPNLANWIKEHPHPVPAGQAARLVASLADGVAHAHTHQVLHRDIKPSNILLAPIEAGNRELHGSVAPQLSTELEQFEPKLTDFGLAKLVENQDMTLSGVIIGTPAYMPPEQISGRSREMTGAVDIYSLGMVLYELVTGKNPFLRETVSETIHAVTNAELTPPRQLRPDLPRDLETIILKCLRSERLERYSSASDLAEDLRRFLANQPIKARNTTSVERFAKWCRRNPLLAAATTGVFALLVSLAIGYRLYSDRLNLALENANQHRQSAEKHAQDAQVLAQEAIRKTDALRRRSYVDDLQMASKAWHASNTPEVERRLKTYLPSPGELDLRTFPWWLMWRSIHESSEILTRHPGGATAVAVQPLQFDKNQGSRQAQVACNEKGEIVLVRDGGSSLIKDGLRTFARKFGPQGMQERASSLIDEDLNHEQEVPDVAIDREGNFVVVWQSKTTSRDDPQLVKYEVYLRRFDSTGVPLTPVYIVNDDGPDHHHSPRIAMRPSGEFVILWTRRTAPGTESRIIARRYHSSASRNGPLIKISPPDQHDVDNPDISMNMQGEFLATWSSRRNAEFDFDVYAQLFDSNANRSGNEFLVNSTRKGPQRNAVSQPGEAGKWTIAWTSHDQDGDLGGIFARRFEQSSNQSGHLSEPEFQVNSLSRGDQSAPSIAGHPDGTFVISWITSHENTSQCSVCMRYFGADGTPAGNEIEAAALLKDENCSQNIAMDGQKRVILNAWTPADSRSHLLQIFDPAGKLIASPLVNEEPLVASGGQEGTIKLIGLNSKRLKAELKGHTKGPVHSLEFYNRGGESWLLSAAEDGQARLWDLGTLQEIRSFPHSDWLPVARFLGKHAERIATGGSDGVIRIWDPRTGKLEHELKGHTKSVRALCSNPDSGLLFSSGEDNSVRVWNWRTGTQDARFKDGILPSKVPSWSCALDISPDGKKLLAGYRGWANDCCLWNIDQTSSAFGEVERVWPCNDGVRHVLWSDSDRFFVLHGTECLSIKAYERNGVPTKHDIRIRYQGLRGRGFGLTSETQSRAFLTADESGDVRIWHPHHLAGDIHGFRTAAEWPIRYGLSQNGNQMSVDSAHGLYTFPLRQDANARFQQLMEREHNNWHAPDREGNGAFTGSLVEQQRSLTRYKFGDDLFGLSEPRTLWKRDLDTKPFDNGVCSPDGRLIAACSDMELILLQADNGEVLFRFVHPVAVYGLCFGQDNQSLVTVSGDGKLRKWSLPDLRLVLEEKVARTAATSISLSLTSPWIAVGTEDRTVKIWDNFQAPPRATFPISDIPVKIWLLDNDSTLAAELPSGAISFWSIDEQVEILRIGEGEDRFYTFSADRKTLISCDRGFISAIRFHHGADEQTLQGRP